MLTKCLFFVHADRIIAFTDEALAAGRSRAGVRLADCLLQQVGVLQQITVNKHPRDVLVIRRGGSSTSILHISCLLGSAVSHCGVRQARVCHGAGEARFSFRRIALIDFHALGERPGLVCSIPSGDGRHVARELVQSAKLDNIGCALVFAVLASE